MSLHKRFLAAYIISCWISALLGGLIGLYLSKSELIASGIATLVVSLLALFIVSDALYKGVGK